jgi:hypothetical protein
LKVGKNPAPAPTRRLVLSPPGARLDLDDIGAEIAKHEPATRPHDHMRELDDANAG